MKDMLNVVSLLIVVMVLIGTTMLMALNNPTEEEFCKWAAAISTINAAEEILMVGQDLMETKINRQSQSYNFYFFSIFIINNKGQNDFYLGTMNNFYDVSELLTKYSQTIARVVSSKKESQLTT